MIDTFAEIPEGKKLYFASDFHLGIPDRENSLQREKKIIRWLSAIEDDAAGIFLVGDIFDFWFEYKHTIPKGFTRFLGKLAELTDSGIPVIIFTGNHDMWMFDYLPQELNLTLHRSSVVYEIRGKKVMIGHGDGLGPGDLAYKFYKKIFNNAFCQWLFEWLHPNIGMAVANFWSKKSRSRENENALNNEAEWLVEYCKKIEEQHHHDYYIFGHRHLASEVSLNGSSTYLNLGEWINQCTFAIYDNGRITLSKFD